MFLDQSLSFNTSLATAQSVTATADSQVIIDITGAGVGNAPQMYNGFPFTNTAMGEDYGAGDGLVIPHVLIVVPTAGSGAGTLTVSVKAAPDSGTYTEGTYTTLVSTQAFVGTALTAGSVIDIPLPPLAPGEALPRFYKLTYTVASSVTVPVIAFICLNPAQVYTFGKYASNFIVV